MPSEKPYCRDSRRTGRQGCGATYSGRQGHCVAHTAWSTHSDGLCHETFASQQVSDLHWTRAGHVDPRSVKRLWQDETGLWHKDKMTPEARNRLPRGSQSRVKPLSA